MTWLIEHVSRDALFDVAMGGLVGIALGWIIGGIIVWAFRLLQRFGNLALTSSATAVLGATLIGWGIAGLADLARLPMMAVAAGITILILSLIDAMVRYG